MPAERYAAKQLSPVNIHELNQGTTEYKGVMVDKEMTKSPDMPKKAASGKGVTTGGVDIYAMTQAPDIGGGYLYDPDGVGGAKSGGLKGK